MSMSDPIADMLTRIRNALLREHEQVIIPASNTKERIAKVLQQEGFIRDYAIQPAKVGSEILISLKYDSKGEPIIGSIQRVSKPGLRIFKGFKEIKPLLNGRGMYIVSTSKGVMSDAKCRQQMVGGEVMCAVH